jgi:hypothetical protein
MIMKHALKIALLFLYNGIYGSFIRFFDVIIIDLRYIKFEIVKIILFLFNFLLYLYLFFYNHFI